jgi:class 3 adenylate cyclase
MVAMGSSVTHVERLTQQRPRAGAGAAAVADPSKLLHKIAADNIAGEIMLHRILTGTTASSTLLVLALWPSIGTELAAPLVCFSLALAAYFALMLIMLQRGLSERWPWLPWVATTIEASVGTAVIAIIGHFKGGAWALSSPAQLISPMFLAIVGLRLRPSLCLYATALTLAQLMLLQAMVLLPGVDPLLAQELPTLSAWGVAERAFWLVMIGIVTAHGAARARDLALYGGREHWARRKLHRELGRYVSSDVAEAILRGEAAFGHAERREVTVLFCDLRNFTSLCEREAPETIVQILNTFFERACAVIAANGGTVNKFLGDGLLVLFGAPEEHPNHARAGAEAAHDLIRVADELRRQGGIWEDFDVGIGLDTGVVVVGAIGAPSRVEYTAIGSTVNRAARLQSIARDQPHRIVVSQPCLVSMGSQANVVSLGPVSLKGFAEPEPVYVFRHS